MVFFGTEQGELQPDDGRCLNRLLHRPGVKMTADVLTKSLEPPQHWKLLEDIGMVAVPLSRQKLR